MSSRKSLCYSSTMFITALTLPYGPSTLSCSSGLWSADSLRRISWPWSTPTSARWLHGWASGSGSSGTTSPSCASRERFKVVITSYPSITMTDNFLFTPLPNYSGQNSLMLNDRAWYRGAAGRAGVQHGLHRRDDSRDKKSRCFA